MTPGDPEEQHDDEDPVYQHPKLAEVLDQDLVDGGERDRTQIGPKRVPMPPKASITIVSTSTWANPKVVGTDPALGEGVDRLRPGPAWRPDQCGEDPIARHVDSGQLRSHLVIPKGPERPADVGTPQQTVGPRG